MERRTFCVVTEMPQSLKPPLMFLYFIRKMEKRCIDPLKHMGIQLVRQKESLYSYNKLQRQYFILQQSLKSLWKLSCKFILSNSVICFVLFIFFTFPVQSLNPRIQSHESLKHKTSS